MAFEKESLQMLTEDRQRKERLNVQRYDGCCDGKRTRADSRPELWNVQ